MKNCRIRMNFRGVTNPGEKNAGNAVLIIPGDLNAPLGWSGGKSNLSLEIVGVPDEIDAAEVLERFKQTYVGPSYEKIGYRLPFARIGRGAWVSHKLVKEIRRELAEFDGNE